jgi:hypothetical protein
VNELTSDSLNVETIVVEGGDSLPPRKGPIPRSVQLHRDYERDKIANPTTPRPYRPYLEPPAPPAADKEA